MERRNNLNDPEICETSTDFSFLRVDVGFIRCRGCRWVARLLLAAGADSECDSVRSQGAAGWREQGVPV